MSSYLNFLKKNVIFLFIGNRELYFLRFLNGKIFAMRSQKISYDTEHDTIKTFFKDYFTGKEGIPVCIVYDIPNQIFTEYAFSKKINHGNVKQAIIKKINNEIAQEAIHDFFQIKHSTEKSSENTYQVVSLVKTSISSICLDLLNKFPNPIAGYFSTILEMPAVCEGTVRSIKMQKPVTVIEQDILDIKEKGVEDLDISIQQSPISGINFCLHQGKRVLFHHNLACNKIDDNVQKEINSTVVTILDYCKQLDVDYRCYIYGSESFLKSLLTTDLEKTSIYYTHPEIIDPKFFYHKQFNINFTKGNSLDSLAFKCLYEPTFFIKNKSFFITLFKSLILKGILIMFAVFAILFFIYQFLTSSSYIVKAITRYDNDSNLNIMKVVNEISSMEKDVSSKKEIVDFYSAFSKDSYKQFYDDVRSLVHNSIYITELNYSCLKDCNGQNAIFEGIIVGNASDLQDYYTIISDIRRVFFRHEIERKINEGTGDFTIKITTLNKK